MAVAIPALAQPETPPVSSVTVHAPVRIGGKPAPTPCATGEATGPKAGGADCAAQELDQAAKLAQARARAEPALNAPEVNAPPIQLGVPTPAAVSQQFGPNFGKSVTPYRPPPAPPAPSALGRIP